MLGSYVSCLLCFMISKKTGRLANIIHISWLWYWKKAQLYNKCWWFECYKSSNTLREVLHGYNYVLSSAFESRQFIQELWEHNIHSVMFHLLKLHLELNANFCLKKEKSLSCFHRAYQLYSDYMWKKII